MSTTPSESDCGIISEAIMYESPFIPSLKAQEGVLETLLAILEKRFSESAVQTLKPALERIEKEQHLKQLLHEACHVTSLDEFKNKI